LGESSKITLVEDTAQEQVLRLVQGRIYSAVDKVEDFEKMLQEKIERIGRDFATGEEQYEAMLRSLRAQVMRHAKKFEVRTPNCGCSVRGTRFSVELRGGDTTEIAVFEGSVEAAHVKGEQRLLVEEGFKAVLTKDGISGPQKITDMDKWWER
jgi:hypothetical protein